MAQNLSYVGTDAYYCPTDFKDSFDFSIKKDKWSGSVSVSSKEVKIGVAYKFYEEKYSTALNPSDGNKNNGTESASLFADVTIKNVKVTNDIDMSWGKLKYARVSVDYETSIEGGLKAKAEENLYRAAPYNNGNGGFITNLKKALKSDMVPAYARGAEKSSGKLKIGSFDLASIGIAKVELGIYLYLDATGKISVKLTTYASKGVEYVNGNIRYINTDAKTTEVTINACIEGGIDFELGVKLLNAKVVAFELKIGVGVDTKLVINFVDDENHLIETGNIGDTDVGIVGELASSGGTISVEEMQKIAEAQGGDYVGSIVTEDIPLHVDNCLEVSVYAKVSLELSSDSLLGKITPKLKKEWKENIISVHVDNFGEDITLSGLLTGTKSTSCTKKFTPFKKLEEELEAELEAIGKDEETEYKWEVGEFLEISNYTINMIEGHTDFLNVTKIPAGYEFKDVVFEVGDSNIAMVSADGTILAINEGVTYIRVYIPNTQYEMRCALIVTKDGVIQYTPIEIA